MKAATFDQLNKNLHHALDEVSNDSDIMVITRENGPAVVMMSLDEYNAWQETIHLLSTPANASRLLEAIDNVEQEQPLVQKEIAELDD